MVNLDANKVNVSSFQLLASIYIHPILLPPCTTHFTASLDDTTFGLLCEGVDHHMRSRGIGKRLTSERQVERMIEATQDASKTARHPEVIERAFKKVGTYPWDPDTIRRGSPSTLSESAMRLLVEPKAVFAARELARRSPGQKDPVRDADGYFVVDTNYGESLDFDELLLKQDRAMKEEEAKKEAARTAKVRKTTRKLARVIKRAAKRAVREAHAESERRTKMEALEARAASRKRRRDERDEAALMAAAAKASRKCRGCGRWWRSNLTDQDWWTCEVCSAYTICPKCDNAQARVERHESRCKGFEVPT